MDKSLLMKYIAGNCDEHEKLIIMEWLDAEPAHMKEYMALRKLYDITLWQMSSASPVVHNKEYRSFLGRGRSFYVELMKIAAILIIGIIILHYSSPFHTIERPVFMQTLFVPAGQRAEITLEDGTKVWLNAKTTLIFPNQFTGKTREVRLDGEGFFEVTTDKSKPFIVKTDKYDVKVWGTKFNLMAYSGSSVCETSLLEGAVEIISPGSTKGLILHPNERSFLNKGNLEVASIIQNDHFLWKEGIISFDNESFTDIVKKLELYFDLKIEVENDKILDYRCTGKFRTKDGIEHILKVLQLRNKFNYTINDKNNIIEIR